MKIGLRLAFALGVFRSPAAGHGQNKPAFALRNNEYLGNERLTIENQKRGCD